MTSQIPNIPAKQKMLEELGMKSTEELFSAIPGKIKINKLNFPDGISEMELKRDVKTILRKNKKLISFLGAGAYNHYVPSAVNAIAQRSEFYTAYTPYQPEISQGMLQAIFEYQSMIAEITGMGVANASMYDSATALAESMLMCARITGNKEFIVPRAIHWEKKNVLRNYGKCAGMKIIEIPYHSETGEIDLKFLENAVSKNTCGVYVENPNLFGIFESGITEVKNIVKQMLVVGVNPITLSIVKSPGEYGADIVIGEGQVLGNRVSFGGSQLGIFACKKEYVRQMPGRIIGLTEDANRKRAFCMTLQTREQHIRRGKATSNICTNEALCALNALVYLAVVGSTGLKEIALENISKAKQFMREINKISGFKAPAFKAYHFNEFVVKSEFDINKIRSRLIEKSIDIGVPLEPEFPELKNTVLCAVTETNTQEDIEKAVAALYSCAKRMSIRGIAKGDSEVKEVSGK